MTVEEMKHMLQYFDKPEPSLCDTCKNAYYIYGSTSFGGKNYMQRYCNIPPEGYEGKNRGRAIHGSGYNECKYYSK
jgi:hypothetical protein